MKKSFICKHILPLLLLVPFLSGCWSSKDIEKLDMLMGLGVDPAEGNGNQDNIVQPLSITFQFAKVTGQHTLSEASEPPKPYTNEEALGDSFIEAARDLILKRKNIINGQHQKLILVSGDIAKDRNIKEITDFFIRDPEPRESTLIMLTDGSAKDLLSFEETEEIPSLHIIEITEHRENSNKLLEPLSLIKLNTEMAANSSFLIQNVILQNNEVKLSGAGAIKGSTLKLAGFLSEEELVGLNWITAKSDGGIVKVFEKNSRKTIIYELKEIKSKITPKLKNKEISFDVNIKVNGIISEVLAETDDMTKEESKKRLQKLIQKKISEQIDSSLKKIQQELQVDVIDFRDYVRIKYPKYWKEHKKEWDTLFSNAAIHYTIEVNILDYGMQIS